jgi:hypothetical protein
MWMSLFVVSAMLIAVVSQASAQGAIEIGGRNAATGIFSVIVNNPDGGSDTTAVLIGATASRTTSNARWEFGGGLTLVATLSDFLDLTIVTPSAQGRINSNLIGPEENILFYAGGLIGITFLNIKVKGEGSFDDTLGAFGLRGGVEYYVSPDIAVQLEELLVFDSDGGVTNNLTLGIKLLF